MSFRNNIPPFMMPPPFPDMFPPRHGRQRRRREREGRDRSPDSGQERLEGRKCGARGSAPCGNPTTSVRVDGQMVRARHCRYHQCVVGEGGMPCREAKAPGAAACADHITCKAMIRGSRCAHNVRDDDPRRWKYCSQLHLCLTEGCESQREEGPGGEDLRFCELHRCRRRGCAQAHAPRLANCYQHTCSRRHCTEAVDGAGAVGTGAWPDPSSAGEGFCRRHRPCQLAGCDRPRYTRPSGSASPYCGSHHCEAEGCDGRRMLGFAGATVCAEHGCGAEGCGQRSTGASRWCEGHKCRNVGCTERGARNSRWCVRCGRDLRGGRRGGGGGGGSSDSSDTSAGDDDGQPGVWWWGRRRRRRRGHSNDRGGSGRDRSPRYGSCIRQDCQGRRSRGSDYCDGHRCIQGDCVRARRGGENGFGPSRYCERHGCSHPQCPRPAGRNGEAIYCDLHTGWDGDRPARRRGGGYYSSSGDDYDNDSDVGFRGGMDAGFWAHGWGEPPPERDRREVMRPFEDMLRGGRRRDPSRDRAPGFPFGF